MKRSLEQNFYYSLCAHNYHTFLHLMDEPNAWKKSEIMMVGDFDSLDYLNRWQLWLLAKHLHLALISPSAMIRCFAELLVEEKQNA